MANAVAPKELNDAVLTKDSGPERLSVSRRGRTGARSLSPDERSLRARSERSLLSAGKRPSNPARTARRKSDPPATAFMSICAGA